MMKETNGYVHGLLTISSKTSCVLCLYLDLKVNFDELKVVRKDCEKVKRIQKRTIIIILCKCDQFN